MRRWLSQDGAAEEHTGGEGEDVTACNQWVLPSRDFHGLWERYVQRRGSAACSDCAVTGGHLPCSLIYESSIKSSLLEYASTAMLFADKHVNSTIISWNRCVVSAPPLMRTSGTAVNRICCAAGHDVGACGTAP
jgi:hypothetical protein